MEKAVKHNDLIANCIMLQNVIDITDVCHALIEEAYIITEEDLSHISPSSLCIGHDRRLDTGGVALFGGSY